MGWYLLEQKAMTFAVALAVAGPVLGAAIGVAFPPKQKWMQMMLAFAGGTMLAISFLQLLPESIAACGVPGAAVGLLIGLLTMLALNDMVPHLHPELAGKKGRSLEKASVLVLAALFLHELPEGIAMASGEAMQDPGAVYTIALAIAVHNIPEGICAAVPYYYTTGNRLRAFLLSASTAIPALLGFFLGKFIFQNVNVCAMGIMMASVAGLMIYITCEELIPTAQESGDTRWPMVSLMVGVAFVMLLETI